ncbi:MAG TPA: HypC/HybG/HupF family hydrogenase formation chaperone [Candidatus Binatia bacterium]|nr:HypC/HybG/HupF family hydrogenase formation chaperone [Candidatus Binatia bacterium]
MCLGVPAKVLEVRRERELLTAVVDFGGVCRSVCLEHVPETQPGEYVLVHVGFALSRIDEEEANRIFALMRELDEMDGFEKLAE